HLAILLESLPAHTRQAVRHEVALLDHLQAQLTPLEEYIEKVVEPSPEVARTISSGGHTWHGRVSSAVNHYLKWAFVEAANAVVRHQNKYFSWHVMSL